MSMTYAIAKNYANASDSDSDNDNDNDMMQMIKIFHEDKKTHRDTLRSINSIEKKLRI